MKEVRRRNYDSVGLFEKVVLGVGLLEWGGFEMYVMFFEKLGEKRRYVRHLRRGLGLRLFMSYWRVVSKLWWIVGEAFG